MAISGELERHCGLHSILEAGKVGQSQGRPAAGQAAPGLSMPMQLCACMWVHVYACMCASNTPLNICVLG